MSFFLSPILRALGQLDDRILWGVVLRSVLWSAVCFAGLHVGAIWVVHGLLTLEGPLAWAADILAAIGAWLLAFWFFVPVAAGIASFFVERIAVAVERRHYPFLPPARGAPLLDQAVDGIILTLRLTGLSILGLALILLIPGIGAVIAWVITGYALGRGLFVAVAMRRMSREQAAWLYRRNRVAVMAQGMLLAVGAWVPLFNLLLPVVAAAAMVHALDLTLIRAGGDPRGPNISAADRCG
ncbi:MAG: EI24 domain-containing protein [Acetobacteraceae bacterium]